MRALILLYACVSLVVLLYMTLWFLISLIRKRNDVADIAWGLGFVIVALTALTYNSRASILSIFATILTAIWGLRLSTHIYLRNRNKPEDFRYAQWRKDWGQWFVLRSYLQVYLLQGFLILAVAAPVIIVGGISNKVRVSAWAGAGAIIWLTGFFFEAVGDFQLNRFIQQKHTKGSIMDAGLWKYTRHPNYFGEVVQWWGLWVILAASDLHVGYIVAGLVGPLSITTLICCVSGIPLLEKKYRGNIAYQKYAAKTSKFFPRDPK